MTSNDLSIFFRPKGVAVIGASRDPEKLGYSAVYNLVHRNYGGQIYPINPKADEILGWKAYPSILDAPDPLDLAVIVLPARYVEQALEECGKRGVKGVTVVSGGFREVGPEGVEREEHIKAIARQYDIALLGPNCIGTIDTHTPINATFVTKSHPEPGEIALVSQSGALAATLIDWAYGSGVGFSRVVSLGNQAGVTEYEMLRAVASDPHTRVVTAYIEGVSDGQKFLKSALEVAREKPLVALKVGRGKSGAKAIASHTGALAGTEAAYEAAFRRAGILRANTIEEVLDWARALAWQPLPQGNRVAILTNAGGPGVMAVDSLEAAGMTLAPLTSKTKAFLRERVLPAASVENPVDILAGSGPATYALCLDALLTDETVDAVVVMTAPQDWFAPVSLAEVVGEVSNSPLGRRKPVLGVIMGSDNEATEVMHRRRTPNFDFAERIGSTLGAMWKRKQWLDAQSETSTTPSLDQFDKQAAQTAIEAAGEGWMSPEQADALLAAYNIPLPKSDLAEDADSALAAAQAIGYPVAMKLAAKDITHKTEVGGVHLNISSDEELTENYWRMINQLDGQATDGVYIQQMVQGELEIIVGVVRDPQFGPLVMVGSGGTHVELLGDVTFELAPVSAAQADAMLDRTSVGTLINGYRGKPAADRQAVVQIIQALAQIALDWPQIAEIEINPVIVKPAKEGAFAVDARMRLD
jgi:acetyltransferase